MKIVSYAEANGKLGGLIDEVVDDADYTVIFREGAEHAVIMSLDVFESLMETVHLFRNPANAAHLAKSIAQYRAGQTVQRERVDAEG